MKRVLPACAILSVAVVAWAAAVRGGAEPRPTSAESAERTPAGGTRAAEGGAVLGVERIGRDRAAMEGRRAQTAPAPLDFTGALAAAKEMPRLHSLLVSHDGELILEQYYNGYSARRAANVKSVAKSIISALVGIAIDRKLLPGIDTPIATWFPELTRDKDPRKQQITLEHLLTMKPGLESTSNRNYGAWVQSGNWVRFALSRPMLADPGEVMDYSTGNTHLLSAILTRATKTSTWEFANEALARPLGFTLSRWPRDPQGIYFGGNDMLLTPRQMVAFGEMYLDEGRVDGKQVVPERWVERSMVPQGRSGWSGQRYGYGWWIREIAGEDAFYAWGFGGQYIIVVPRLELVVVATSSPTVAEDRRSHRVTLFDLIEQQIVGRIAGRAVETR
jgi:CubicO group peptidase (beta-lactamase class C family)